MNIEELRDKHRNIETNVYKEFPLWQYPEHTKLSIQFAIEMLQELQKIGDSKNFNEVAWSNLLYIKTENLKELIK